VVADDLGDLVLQLADRQLGRVSDRGYGMPARLHAGFGRRKLRADLAERPLPPRSVRQRRCPADATGQPVLVAQHQPGQPGSQRGERGRQGGSLRGGRRVHNAAGTQQGWSGSPRRPNAFAARLLPPGRGRLPGGRRRPRALPSSS
jgi:hypothetical protein